MATDGRGGWFRRTTKPTPQLRVLTAAASRITIDDRKAARAQRALRQGWQSDAWNYREMLGELRYAVNFLANCTARMRLFPAAYATGAEGDPPVPLSELANIPPDVVEKANAALAGLGNGKLAISGLLHSMSTNWTVAGECWLLGREDAQTGAETWTIRSVEEIVIQDEKYRLREAPAASEGGVIPWVDLDPDLTVLSRLWQPSPRFHLMADSPMKAILDDCESLMILRRMIRATGRSRLAGRGLLFVPEELSIKVAQDDNDDPESDPFLKALTEAMTEPIGDEGVASAVVPIVVRGPGEMGKLISHTDFASSFDDKSSEVRAELVGVIATGLDLPKEVIEGISDLNHWSSWQVDDNTFRHHVEPHVIAICDALTAGYLRPALEAVGVSKQWADRMVLWYDPTELVTHPDRTQDAKDLHTALAISDKTFREAAGFTEADAPSPQEIETRLLHGLRGIPVNVLLEWAHRLDPTLIVPPITNSGTIPGIKAGGVDTGEPDLKQLPAGPPVPDAVVAPAPAAGPSGPQPGPPPADRPAPKAVTAASAEQQAGVMVAFYLPLDVAQTVALEGGEDVADLHLTLAFLGDAVDLPDPQGLLDAVTAWARSTPPLTGEISGLGLFTAGPDPVTYLSVDMPDLPDARQALVDAIDAHPVSTEHGFTPHVTLDYADRVGEAAQAAPGGTDLVFDTVSVVIGPDRTDIPLKAPAAVTAASRPHRLTRKLVDIDRDLRTRLQTAACAAMLRQLERAGARLRTKVAKDETLRTKIAQRPNERVAAILGEAVTAAVGVSAQDLMGGDWSSLKGQFYDWTEQAQKQAIATAMKIGDLHADDDAVIAAELAMAQGRDEGWAQLQTTLTDLGHHLLYNPDPNIGPGEWGELNPDTLVPVGMIRAAVGLAGGGTPTAVLGDPVGQIGTGSTISDLLTSAGATTHGYEWVHGPALNPFEPHEALDGVEFESFDDESLANTGDYPSVAFFLPGDHEGCSCDFMPLWDTSSP